MKSIKKEYIIENDFSEKFLKKILKNGQKYKYFKYFKNIIILFSKYYYINYLNVPTFRIVDGNIISEKSLMKNFHDYTFIIKNVYKKKKWRKFINVTRLSFNYSKEKEIYKLIYYILFFLKIRTFQLKLFYLIYIFNFRFFKKIKIYKKLKKYYFNQLKNQKLIFLSVFKRKFYFGKFLPLINKINKIKYNWNFNLYTDFQSKLKKRLNFKLNNKKIIKKYFFFKKYLKFNLFKKFLKRKFLRRKHLKKYIKRVYLNKKYLNKKHFLIQHFNKNLKSYLFKVIKLSKL